MLEMMTMKKMVMFERLKLYRGTSGLVTVSDVAFTTLANLFQLVENTLR